MGSGQALRAPAIPVLVPSSYLGVCCLGPRRNAQYAFTKTRGRRRSCKRPLTASQELLRLPTGNWNGSKGSDWTPFSDSPQNGQASTKDIRHVCRVNATARQQVSGRSLAGSISALVSCPAMVENLLRWAEEVSGRPFCAEARSSASRAESLKGRSAPRPLLRRRGRISGPACAGSLHSQARWETAQGRGAEASPYRRRQP
jgi:hypothetical protein